MDTFAPLDVDGVRLEIARISALARSVLPKTFQFATVTIWGSQHHGRNAAVEVRLHIHGASKAFTAPTPAEAIRDAERWLREHDPVKVEAAGWAILGVVRA